MALTPAALASEIVTQLNASFPTAGAGAAVNFVPMAQAIATAVVTVLVRDGIVTVTPAGSVTACPAGAGTITTAVGTIS